MCLVKASHRNGGNMINVVDFICYNKEKWLTFEVWFWAAIYRWLILIVPAKKMKKYYGIMGEESLQVESKQNYDKAWKISFHINRVSEHTPWESKCLVRALTAQKLLKKQKISSTLYLGVKKEGEKMVAHSWIRTGKFYLTGGDGKEYAIVAKFRK